MNGLGMSGIDKIEDDDLGVKVSGSARAGHNLNLSRDDALCQIFNTRNEKQAKAGLPLSRPVRRTFTW